MWVILISDIIYLINYLCDYNFNNQLTINTRKSRCLAGEPKHFPFAIVFVKIIKNHFDMYERLYLRNDRCAGILRGSTPARQIS